MDYIFVKFFGLDFGLGLDVCGLNCITGKDQTKSSLLI